MPPKKSETATNAGGSAAEGATNILPADLKIILSVLRASTIGSKPWLGGGTVHWDQVSEELQYKNSKIARDRMNQKYGLFEAPAAEAATDGANGGDKPATANGGGKPTAAKTTAATKGKGKGKGKRSAADADADDAVANDTADEGGHGDGEDVKKPAKKAAKKVKISSPE